MGISNVFTAANTPGEYKVSTYINKYPGSTRGQVDVKIVDSGIYLAGPWVDGMGQKREKILGFCDSLKKIFKPIFLNVPSESITWETKNGVIKDLGNGYFQFVPSGDEWGAGFEGTVTGHPEIKLSLSTCYPM